MPFNPLFAGPICSGFWDCLPLTAVIYASTVLPFAVTLFALCFIAYKLLKKKTPHWRWMILFAAVSLPLAHIGYGYLQAQKTNNHYQTRELEKAKKVEFQLYQPTYMIPGYDLVESEIDFQNNLVYTYYDRSTQQSRDSVAGKLYSIEVQPATTDPIVIPDAQSMTIVASKTIDDTTIAIAGTISRSEAEKVLDAMQKVSASDIKFHSDWASTR